MKFLFGATLVFLSAGLENCGSGGGQAKVDPKTLDSTAWELKTFGDPARPRSPLESTRITLEFGLTEENVPRISGGAGCNRYSASYQFSDETFKVGPVASTRRRCVEPEGIMAQESEYLGAIEAAQSLRLTETGLRIVYPSGELHFQSFEVGSAADSQPPRE